ncbi:hypothetical protein AVEN_13913-1 [Araneus ventricosus]|uniref:Uncharacterized protein n=1 Tax=Araneus ventricosus TaxID=182803 RepID=A0A4Y2HXN7_ARAVE|nr:hypothetical protein AVEN_13913-1 [Araneus ventricosus]
MFRETRVNTGLNGLGNGYMERRELCILLDQEDMVHHELLKSSEIFNNARYQRQIVNLNHALIVKRPQWASRHDNVISLPDNASPNKHVKRSNLGSIAPTAVFSRPCAVRFSLVPVDNAHSVSTALTNVRRCGPTDRVVIIAKR